MPIIVLRKATTCRSRDMLTFLTNLSSTNEAVFTYATFSALKNACGTICTLNGAAI